MSQHTRSFSEAADRLRAPGEYFSSPAFSRLRWTLAGEQRDERMRLFTRKLLQRLDGMDSPFYPAVGLMDHKTALRRYVTAEDVWKPIESPYLDGSAVLFKHCILQELDFRQWVLFAEIGFDVAALAQIPVMWGGFSEFHAPGLWRIYDGVQPSGWRVDNRTYKVRNRGRLDYQWALLNRELHPIGGM